MAATTGQPRHFLLHGAGGDAEQVGDVLALLRRTYRAFGGNGIAADHLLGEVAAAGLAAGAAVGLGQQVLDLADALALLERLLGEMARAEGQQVEGSTLK